MTSRALNRIACALLLQTRADPDIQSALISRFGFAPQRGDASDIARMGGKSGLVIFWEEQIAAREDLRHLADELLGIHSTVSPQPGILTDARSFAKSLRGEAAAIFNGDAAVSRRVAAQRLAACRDCPQLRRDRLGSRCNLCNCFVRLKTKFRTESCPAGKWL